MIELKQISKKFHSKPVLKNLSTTFNEGKVYGLLGNNGAGKTTLLRLIFNELALDGGTITYNGKKQGEIDYSQWMYFTENNELPSNITVINFLRRCASLAHISESEFKNRLVNAQKIIELGFSPRQKIKNLSAGQKKIVSCLLILIMKPKIIFFDEPTANLDQSNKKIVMDIIRALQTNERIIVVITHLISEVESVLTDVAILDEGIIKINTPLGNNNAMKIFNKYVGSTAIKQETNAMGEYLND